MGKADMIALKDICETHIRAGRLRHARNELLKLKPKSIPRDHLADIANLARRAEIFSFGLQLLHPIIRSERRLAQPATQREQVIYASLLTKLGLTDEALGIFAGLQEQTPEAHLHRAFAYFSQWDYVAAVPYLESYLRSPNLTEYQKMIGVLNLAAAHSFNRKFRECRELLDPAIRKADIEGWHLLLLGACELRGQVGIFEKSWDEARHFLERSLQLSSESPLGQLFANKWLAVLELRRKGVSKSVLAKLQDVKKQAIQLQNWETVRDCDYHRCLAEKDENLFLQVYFGTPFSSFREKMAEDAAGWFTIPETYVRQLGNKPATRVFDLDHGTEDGRDIELKPGQASHRLLRALAVDTYRAQSIGRLFSLVHPGEYFDPSSSPKRILTAVRRLRNWLVAAKIPLQVNLTDGEFRLDARGPYGILLRREISVGEVPSRETELLRRLQERLPDDQFSSRQAAEVLGVSVRLVNFLVRQALENEQVEQLGRGPMTLYRFKRSA